MKTIPKILILLLLISCASSKKNNKQASYSILDIKWHIEALNGEVVDLPEKSPEVFILFTSENPKKVQGHNGCNSFFGGYEISGDSLRLIEVAQTLRACGPPFAELETKFMEALEGVERYFYSEKQLFLLGESDTLMVFRE